MARQARKESLQNESEKKTATEVTALKDANILLFCYKERPFSLAMRWTSSIEVFVALAISE